MPGLQVMSLVGGRGMHERQPHIDVSLSPSLPFSLKMNKNLKKTCQFKEHSYRARKCPKIMKSKDMLKLLLGIESDGEK